MLEADHLKSPTGSASLTVKTTGLTNARALDGVALERLWHLFEPCRDSLLPDEPQPVE
jgi:hypothetical protein